MKKIFWTFRPERITSPYNLEWWLSLNWTYTPSFFLNNQFADWNKAWLTNVIDNIIPEESYILEVAPWVKKLTRFIMCEYNEQYVDQTELARSLKNIWARFDIDIFTDIETARQRIRTNTNLQEVETGKFLIREATNEFWTEVPAEYLEIN